MRRFLASLLLTSLLAACADTGATASVPWATPDAKADTTTASGLGYSVQVPAPAGAAKAAAGQKVTVKYAGWLTSGKLFDSSFAHGGTFSFTLGAGNVIKGWDDGVKGMAVCERRKLVVPGNLAYGPSGTDGIPPNATLIFDVELVSIQ